MDFNFKNIATKNWIFAVILAGTAGFVGWSFQFINFSAEINIFGVAIWFLAVMIFVILLSFFALVEKNILLIFLVTIISSWLFFIFQPFQDIYLWGILGSVIFLSWGIYSLRREASVYTRYVWFSILPKGTKKIFTALALAAAVIYFTTVNLNVNASDALLPRAFFDGMATIMERPFGVIFPGFNFSDTIDETIVVFLTKQGEQINLQNLPKNILRQLVATQRLALAQKFGLKISGKEKISDLVHQTAVNIVNNYTKPYKEYLPAAMAFGYFITLKFMLFFIGLIVTLLFPVAVWFFVSIGIIKKDNIMVSKEILSI